MPIGKRSTRDNRMGKRVALLHIFQPAIDPGGAPKAKLPDVLVHSKQVTMQGTKS